MAESKKLENEYAKETERRKVEAAEAIRIAISTNNAAQTEQLRADNEKAKIDMDRQYAEQQRLMRELAETRHSQQVAEHHRTRELQELEHQKSLRALQEIATAEIRYCSDKQAATELEMRKLKKNYAQHR